MQSNYNPPQYDAPSAPPPNYQTFQIHGHSVDVPRELEGDFEEARSEVMRVGLENHEARVCLILDVSYSMQNPNEFFTNENHPNGMPKGNKVQRLINKALSLALLFDDNQQVELIAFAGEAYQPIVINKDNFSQATKLVTLQQGTNYAAAVQATRNLYFSNSDTLNSPQMCNQPPVFAIFITDGEPNRQATEALNQFISASHQAIFFKFLGLKGKQEDTEFKYIQSLDDYKVEPEVKKHSSSFFTCCASPAPKTKKSSGDRFFVDNCDLVTLDDPDHLTMEKLIKEYRLWLIEAHQKKLLKHAPQVTVLASNGSEGRITANKQADHKDSAARSLRP
jgi:uncharacterized protein YegL